ncbi:MAG: hypothetical protein EHM31_06880 [Candidatus Aminicenantes bacterium]|nr:MAG: hypothetical protein EHM31_06880 [Candidatus Aminicenantes bacterium]
MKKTIGFLLFSVFVVLVGTSCIRYVPYGESGRYSGPYDDQRYDNRYSDRYDDLDSAYFYDELQPYGLWVSYQPYGYVWTPGNVGYNWRPYTRGHWAWTDYGWTWVSLERWGWIAFHYGRWGWDRGLGWYWVPDIVWGPAWVAWRWGDAHIGWAPLPPGVDFIPGRGFGRRQWDIPGYSWSFVRGRDFMDRRIDRWVLPRERNMMLVERTELGVNINERDRRVVNEGLDPDLVRRQINRPVDRLTLKDSTRPGMAREEGSDLIISKPVIRRNEAAKPKEVLDQSAAERELNSETSSRIRRNVTQSEAQIVREDHEQERRLMKESQDSEVSVVRRRAAEEKAKVQNPVEKKKVDEQANSRVAELRKKHEQEKAELAKRQKTEEEKTRRTPVRRKIDDKR